MQVEIKIDSAYTQPKILILTAEVTEEIKNTVQKLSEEIPPMISGKKDEKIEVLDPQELIRIYANRGKVYAVTAAGEYTLNLRLYEAEERLAPHWFVRISNAEIINLKKVSHFDLNFTGTIRVVLANGTFTYVSRRYVSKIKKILGI